MTQWEYKTIYQLRNNLLGEPEVLNRYGLDGWEAFHVQEIGLAVYVYMKRPTCRGLAERLPDGQGT